MAIRYPGERGGSVTPHVRRSERRWAIAIGGREVAFTRSSYSWALTAPASDRRLLTSEPPRPTIARGVGLVLAMLAGVTTIAIAVQSGRASAGGRYVVSLAVPPPPARSVPVPAPRPRHHAGVKRTVAATPVAVAPVADEGALAIDEPGADAAAGATTLASRQQAIAAALGTGRMAQWSGDGGNERGFIIAGPVESGADGECRALSVLVRRFGEPDSVEKRRDCLPRVHRGGVTTG